MPDRSGGEPAEASVPQGSVVPVGVPVAFELPAGVREPPQGERLPGMFARKGRLLRKR